MLSPARSEYFAQGDCKECGACIAEVAASQRAEYCARLVSRAIDLSLDKREREQEMVSALFVQLSRAGARCRQPRPVAPLLPERPRALPAGALARELLAAGFAEVAEFVEDLVADIPKAQEIFDGSAENVPSFNPVENESRANRRVAHRMRAHAIGEGLLAAEAASAPKPVPAPLTLEVEAARLEPPAGLERLHSAATSAGDYTPAYDDGVPAFEDEDL